MLEHRVERDYRRHSQRTDEIEDVLAVVAAEDPVFVLNADEAQMAEVHELRGAGVVRFDVLPDLELHFIGILVLPRGLGYGEHHRQDAAVVTGDRKREIGSERRDSAAAWTVGADERDWDCAVDRLVRQFLRQIVGVSEQRSLRAAARRRVRYCRHRVTLCFTSVVA